MLVIITPRVNPSVYLFGPDRRPPSGVQARTEMCAHVKRPTSICRKSVGLTAGGMETRTHGTQGGGSWVAPYYGCSVSPGKADVISHALHWDNKVV